jgi:hypothetical protein
VKYKICSNIEHKDKLLAPKWNSPQKHLNKRRANKPMKRVKKGEWYVNKECKHKKIEIVYASKGKEFILQQVTNGLAGEKHKKLVQFATLFHTLKHARPMLEYEVHKDLFDHLNLEKNSKMY